MSAVAAHPCVDELFMSAQLIFPAVLDACCGPRMMWFDGKDRRALFIDKRQETHEMGGVKDPGRSPVVVAPDIVADFRSMPFPDESFYLVVFDPPHIKASRAGQRGRFKKIYGVLPHDWRGLLRDGFAECFRVLRPHGTLVFKWSEHCYPMADVLALTPHKPLFGHRTTRTTHWYVFMKQPSPS
jgi:SAM-dependent methyltransferase